MDDLTSGWKASAVVGEGESLRLGGLDVWQTPWKRSSAPAVIVSHPQYPSQRHIATQYVISGPDGDIRFAASELSPNCWGFYTPD